MRKRGEKPVSQPKEDKAGSGREWLSKSIGDRILVLSAGLAAMFVTGILVAGVCSFRPETLLERVLRVFLLEAFTTFLLSSGLAVFWAVFAPTWVEKALQKASMKAAVFGGILAIAMMVLVAVIFAQGG